MNEKKEFFDAEVVGKEGDDGGPVAEGPPVHPLSALVLITVDNLWMFAEFATATWFVTIPLSFLTVAIPTYLIQKTIKKDPPRRASRLALLLGTLAAVPMSIFGTPVGLGLLAWTGLHRLFGKTALAPAAPKPKR